MIAIRFFIRAVYRCGEKVKHIRVGEGSRRKLQVSGTKTLSLPQGAPKRTVWRTIGSPFYDGGINIRHEHDLIIHSLFQGIFQSLPLPPSHSLPLQRPLRILRDIGDFTAFQQHALLTFPIFPIQQVGKGRDTLVGGLVLMDATGRGSCTLEGIVDDISSFDRPHIPPVIDRLGFARTESP